MTTTIVQDTSDYQVVRTTSAAGFADQVILKGAALTAQTNTATIVSKANAALAANATFLGLASPTNPQVLAQVQLLTREVNALIRLFLSGDALQDVSNT